MQPREAPTGLLQWAEVQVRGIHLCLGVACPATECGNFRREPRRGNHRRKGPAALGDSNQLSPELLVQRMLRHGGLRVRGNLLVPAEPKMCLVSNAESRICSRRVTFWERQAAVATSAKAWHRPRASPDTRAPTALAGSLATRASRPSWVSAPNNRASSLASATSSEQQPSRF
jgi:hypothetical protein